MDKHYTSRYILKSDEHKNTFITKLPETWWSRPYEYAWAANFMGKDLTVLDAACGIEHPFKYYLAENCQFVDATDHHPKIKDVAHNYSNLTLYHTDLTDTPSQEGTYDRVFCISVLEHLNPIERIDTLMEFYRVLKPSGLAVITCDIPLVTPVKLITHALQIGFSLPGPAYPQAPDPSYTIYSEEYGLYCYRLLLQKS